MELSMILERYDALVREARSLEAMLKLHGGTGGSAGRKPGADALEARRLLALAGLSHEEAALRMGMPRSTLTRKLNGYERFSQEETRRLAKITETGKRT